MPNDPMRLEVRDKEIEEKLKDIGLRLKLACGPKYGFALLLFGFGEDQSLFYCSNGQRDDMINVMKEFIAKYQSN